MSNKPLIKKLVQLRAPNPKCPECDRYLTGYDNDKWLCGNCRATYQRLYEK